MFDIEDEDVPESERDDNARVWFWRMYGGTILFLFILSTALAIWMTHDTR